MQLSKYLPLKHYKLQDGQHQFQHLKQVGRETVAPVEQAPHEAQGSNAAAFEKH